MLVKSVVDGRDVLIELLLQVAGRDDISALEDPVQDGPFVGEKIVRRLVSSSFEYRFVILQQTKQKLFLFHPDD